LFEQFQQWEREYDGNPLREDAFKRASRVRRMLESVIPVSDETAVPPDSVLREFIGGSILEH
jgi:uridine kinase